MARCRELVRGLPLVVCSCRAAPRVCTWRTRTYITNWYDAAWSVRIDLSEVGSQPYHSGLVFSVYAPGIGSAIAAGGRYDYREVEAVVRRLTGKGGVG